MYVTHIPFLQCVGYTLFLSLPHHSGIDLVDNTSVLQSQLHPCNSCFALVFEGYSVMSLKIFRNNMRYYAFRFGGNGQESHDGLPCY